MTAELQQQPVSSEDAHLEKMRELVSSFAEKVSLARGKGNLKRNLELIAEGCYLVSGIQALAGIRKLDALVAHEKNMGRMSPEVDEWLTKTKNSLSSGARSTSSRSLTD